MDWNIGHVGDVVQKIQEWASQDHDTKSAGGVKTGFSTLDEILGGFQRGTLSLIAGRPSMGKTALALGIALHAALTEKQKVLYLTCGHSLEAMGRRLLSSYAGIDSHRLRHKRFVKGEAAKMQKAVEELKSSKLFLCDLCGLSVETMDLPVHMLCKWDQEGMKDPPALVVVDALDDLRIEETPVGLFAERDENEERQSIMAKLHKIARDYETALLALVTLRRTAENRPEGRPYMGDLPHRNLLEPWTDNVLLVYRPSYYAESSAQDDPAEVIVAKNRTGLTGVARLIFNRACMRFEEAPAE